jgi:hypothetical protein
MSFSQFPLPAKTINGYLWKTMKEIEPSLARKYGKTVPFFPVSDSVSGKASWDDKPYVIYDRMLKLKPGPFYVCKKEHLLYYIKGKETDIFEWGLAMQFILDRMDDAAQDVNAWNRLQEVPAKIYFHHLRVYQTDSGDMSSATSTRDFSTRPNYISQFVVEAEYHFTESIESILS